MLCSRKLVSMVMHVLVLSSFVNAEPFIREFRWDWERSRVSDNFPAEGIQESTPFVVECPGLSADIAKDVFFTLMGDKEHKSDQPRSYQFACGQVFVAWTPTNEDRGVYLARMRFRGKEHFEAAFEIARLTGIRSARFVIRYATPQEIGDSAVVSDHAGHAGRAVLVRAGNTTAVDFGISAVKTFGRVAVTLERKGRSMTIDNNVNDMERVGFNDAQVATVSGR